MTKKEKDLVREAWYAIGNMRVLHLEEFERKLLSKSWDLLYEALNGMTFKEACKRNPAK